MKNRVQFLLCLILVLLLFFSSNFIVTAEEISSESSEKGFDDSLIIDFSVKPDLSLAGMKPVTISFKSLQKIDDLKVSVFCTATGEKYQDLYRSYITIYDSNWDFELLDEKEIEEINSYYIKFRLVNNPVDDPETEEDETLNAVYEYELKVKLFETNYSLYKLVFDYSVEEKNYSNYFYFPNTVYRSDVDEINSNDDNDNESSKTYESIVSCSLAALCCVFGTIVIILMSDRKKIEDE